MTGLTPSIGIPTLLQATMSAWVVTEDGTQVGYANYYEKPAPRDVPAIVVRFRTTLPAHMKTIETFNTWAMSHLVNAAQAIEDIRAVLTRTGCRLG